jgi:hypothetical protein
MKYSIIISTWVCLLSIACNKDQPIPPTVPNFDKNNFSNPTIITNEWYGPASDKTYIYEGGQVGKPRSEKITISRRNETRVVAGITCIIHHDVVHENGVLLEDTDDWIAQDDKGNLWYLGEDVDNYDTNGKLINHDGAWETGVNGALPGYWNLANPKVGDKYHQEYLQDEAEDEVEVLSTNETVSIALGTYTNCVLTKNYTILEPGVYEKKYYAKGVGFIKEQKFENNILVEELELVKIY